jgi:hypothetical protein
MSAASIRKEIASLEKKLAKLELKSAKEKTKSSSGKKKASSIGKCKKKCDLSKFTKKEMLEWIEKKDIALKKASATLKDDLIKLVWKHLNSESSDEESDSDSDSDSSDDSDSDSDCDSD